MKSRAEVEASTKVFEDIMRAARAAMNDFRKKRGKMSNVRQQLERVLVDHGIVRAAYHGGDMNGTYVLILLQKCDEIFEDFKQTIVKVPEDERCDNDEVADMTRRYVELCTLLDGLFSIARTPTGEATEEILQLAQRYVTAVMVKWRDLRLSMRLPKVHGLEDHLVQQMRRFKGIGCFIEDFIEQAHQFGMKDEARTRNMRDRARAAISHSKWEWASHNVKVLAAKKEICNKTSRKRKGRDHSLAETAAAEKKKARLEKRKASLESVSLIPNPIETHITRSMLEHLDNVTSEEY